jgi:hypothetical protein
MSNYGFRISEIGYDVKTCLNRNCVVTSKYPLLKGGMQGSVSGSHDGVVNEYGDEEWWLNFTINHNLGYIPVVRVFNDLGTEFIEIPNDNWAAGIYQYYSYYEITTTQLFITVGLWVAGGDPGFTLSETFKYYISNEKVNI